eukprot:1139692-Pelagomonas_calceolata.AAC.2
MPFILACGQDLQITKSMTLKKLHCLCSLQHAPHEEADKKVALENKDQCGFYNTSSNIEEGAQQQ